MPREFEQATHHRRDNGEGEKRDDQHRGQRGQYALPPGALEQQARQAFRERQSPDPGYTGLQHGYSGWKPLHNVAAGMQWATGRSSACLQCDHLLDLGAHVELPVHDHPLEEPTLQEPGALPQLAADQDGQQGHSEDHNHPRLPEQVCQEPLLARLAAAVSVEVGAVRDIAERAVRPCGPLLTHLAKAAHAGRADVDTKVGAAPDVDVVLGDAEVTLLQRQQHQGVACALAVGTDGAWLAHGQRGGVNVGVARACVDLVLLRLVRVGDALDPIGRAAPVPRRAGYLHLLRGGADLHAAPSHGGVEAERRREREEITISRVEKREPPGERLGRDGNPRDSGTTTGAARQRAGLRQPALRRQAVRCGLLDLVGHENGHREEQTARRITAAARCAAVGREPAPIGDGGGLQADEARVDPVVGGKLCDHGRLVVLVDSHGELHVKGDHLHLHVDARLARLDQDRLAAGRVVDLVRRPAGAREATHGAGLGRPRARRRPEAGLDVDALQRVVEPHRVGPGAPGARGRRGGAVAGAVGGDRTREAARGVVRRLVLAGLAEGACG
eukprot:scaffold50958_cov59-Phaeocystis_antarctica.AAC.1